MSNIEYAPQWTINRVNYITNRYKEYFEKSSTLINMGARFGDISLLIHQKFPHLKILNEEGRQKIVEIGKIKYPQFEWKCIDYEKCKDEEFIKADVIINWGLLYHISTEKAKDLLNASIKRTNKILLLESEVIDCDNEPMFIVTNGNFTKESFDTSDQGLTKEEIKPSISWINKIILDNNLIYDFIESPELNGNNHKYDWKIFNSKKYRMFYRKMWAIFK